MQNKPDKTGCTPEQIDLTDLARQFQRFLSSCDKGDLTNANNAENEINSMLQKLPSGSGIDCGMKFDWQKSKPNKLIFSFDYHHMNSTGNYDGWTKHKLTISPCFVFGFVMKISGPNKNNVKEYLYEVFSATFWY